MINKSMPGVSRVTTDNAGGLIVGPGAPTVFTEGQPTSTVNDNIATHGDPPHVGATMVGSSGTVYAEGKLVCRSGDNASCGHSASGSGTVFAG